MSGHTRWSFDKDEGDWLVVDDGFSIICVVHDETEADPEKTARLIAAAPAMLDALVRARRALAFACEYKSVFEDEYELVDSTIKAATGGAE